MRFMAYFPLIVLMTDYGLADPFSGILKGVISRIAPEVAMIDLTHEIPRGDILRGAINLWQARPFFPEGTIFLCVVDPGVGTTRRGILVNSGGYSFIGPDNGLFTFIYETDFKVRELYNPAYFLPITSTTFHGRDIFAPVAAYVARSIPAEELGPVITNPTRLPLPRLDCPNVGVLQGECLVGSSGLLEIVANQQSATNLLGLGVGETVILKSEGDLDGKILDRGWISS